MNLLVPVLLLVVGIAAVAAGSRSLRRAREERRFGSLVAIDVDRPLTLRSERYRLVGRPDVLRRDEEGRVIPVELKARGLPPGGPFPSHRAQLAAYCLLVEETTGRSPPFGVLRYADGEVLVPWGVRERAQLVRLLEKLRAPYDGRADPSPAKCAACAWSAGCDASRAPGGGPPPRTQAARIDLRPVR
jgi:CRISPR-associated exonuclease Cas4